MPISILPLRRSFCVARTQLGSLEPAGSKLAELGKWVVLLVQALLLAAISSPIPRFLIASAGPCPAVANSGSSYPMDFAARSAFLSAAAVEMSGLGLPFGTATAV